MKKKMPTPRPRILGSPRIKRRDTNGQSDPQCSIAPKRNSDEPDCEIIKIEEDVDEKKPAKLFNAAVTIEVSREQPKPQTDATQFIKLCPMRLQEFNCPSSQTFVAPISPSLALQFVPDTSMSSAMHAQNIYSSQSVVMVLPVNSGSSQIFNAPTLCTLQRIDNPNEISQIKEIITIQPGNRRPPSNPPPLCTMNVRRDSNKHYIETRKRMLQKIFTNSTTDVKAESNARCLIPWIKRENPGDTVSSDYRMNSTLASGETIGNVTSFNGPKRSKSLSIESDATITSMDIQECFVSVSKNAGNTHCLVDSTISDPLSRESVDNTSLANQIDVISKSNASTDIRVPLDIFECFVSVSNNTISNCCAEQQTSSNSRSENKQSELYMQSQESGNITNFLGRNKHPVPRLTKIIDKVGTHGDRNITISISQETRENVESSQNEKRLISTLQEIPDDVDFSEYKENSFSTAEEITDSDHSPENGKRSIPTLQEIPDDVYFSEYEENSFSTPREITDSVDSPENDERSISVTQKSHKSVNSLGNSESSTSLPRKSPDEAHCPGSKKRLVPLLKELAANITPLDVEKDTTHSEQSKGSIDSNDSLNAPRNSSRISQIAVSQSHQHGSPVSSDRAEESFPVIDVSPTKSAEISRRESIDAYRWTAQCIVCKKTFSDRNKLHRHATLTHPNVQILFCGLCSSSFLTDHALREHRAVHDEREKSLHDVTHETFGTDDENENFLVSKEKSTETLRDERSMPRRREASKLSSAPIAPSPGHSRLQKKRTRGRRPYKKIATNGKTKNCPFSPNSSGVERRKPQTKNKTVIVKYSYVEEDVVKHVAMASKSKFKSAEIKRLTVPLERLDGPVLQGYLEKLAAAPVTEFAIKNPKKQETYERDEEKRNASSSDSERIVVPRRGKRKRRPTIKMRRQVYTKRRNRRRVEGRKKFAINSDSDTGEIFHNNDVSATSSVRSFSIVSSMSDDEKISASKNLSKKRKYDDSEEPMESGSSAIQLVSEMRSNETEEATTRGVPLRKRKLALKDEHAVSSQQKNDIGITRRNRTIMRKLTSPSSAAKVVALGVKRRLRRSRNAKRRSNELSFGSTKEIRDFSNSEKNTSPGCMRPHNQRRDSSSQSDMDVNEEFTREPDDMDIDETTKFTSFDDSKTLKIRRPSLNSPIKTYLPSRRYSQIAAKLRKQCNDAKSNATRSNDPCSVCEELLTTMKRVTAEFESRSVDRNSVECPFCDLHFIAMFYLEEHVASNHLRCKNETPCRRSRGASSTSSNLDCETEVALALECPQCTTIFAKEEDLNDHIIIDHDASTPLKEISTNSITPDYLNDLSNFCFQTPCREKTVDLSSKRSTNVDQAFDTFVTCSEGKTTSDGSIVEINENSFEKDRNFVCWLCDTGFEEREEHARHLREVHNATSEKVPSTQRFDQTDQTITDREYLLKQLMSDDSMDGFEEVNDSEIESTAKEVAIELVDENVNSSSGKRVIDLLSMAHTCKVCCKKFNRTQDLLIHSLLHEKNCAEDDGMFSKTARIATPNKDSPINDNVFANNSDNEETDNFVVIQEQVDAKDKVAIGNQQTATKITEKINKSADRNSSLKKSRREQLVAAKPEANETRNEKRDTLKELLDTEAGLANDTNSNDKVPIECGKCNRKFPNQSSLNEHLFFLHDDSIKDTVLTDVLNKKPKNLHQRWRCRACRQDFKFLQGYRRHRYLAHGDESMVHVCENCCKILTTVTMVNVHICTDVASYNCRTCEETFNTGMSLRLHNSEKHMENDEPNICEPCNKNFLTKSMLKRHEKSRHRFLRPYRPRKRSPVLMATHDGAAAKKIHSSDRNFDESEDCAIRFNGEENETMDFEFESREATGKDYQTNTSTSPIITDLAGKRRGNHEETSNENCNLSNVSDIRDFRDTSNVTSKCLEINENEIYRCSLCRLHCLTKSALEIHVAKSHLGTRKICQICRKLYAHGKAIRHMIDYHINPCETSTETSDSIWNFEKNTSERDVELFVRILGMQRLTTLWEYRGRDETTKDSRLVCSACDTNFSNLLAYRFHILMNHDVTCVLCNIEFKSPEDAAEHKNEEHRSAACYMWFVDRTLKELTTASNFHEVMERNFMDMISRDTAESHDNYEDFFDDMSSDTGETTYTEEPTETLVNVGNTEKTALDENASLSVDLKENHENEEENDEKLIVVVTDEDLEKYNIGTRYPNIWGLASHISSTCESLTPKDVKEMLESYFEN